MKYKTFETERLYLVPTAEKDALLIYEIFNSPKWLTNIGDRKVYSEEDAKIYIRTKMRPQLERLGFSTYTIIRKVDKAKIGTCGLYDREGLEGLDVGFAFLPQFEKKGYAFEASSELLRAAREEFGITTIKAITTKENFESQKLLEKLGLELNGLVKVPGDEEELLLYEKDFLEDNNFKNSILRHN